LTHRKGHGETKLHINGEKLFAYHGRTAAVSPAEVPQGTKSARRTTGDNPFNRSQL